MWLPLTSGGTLCLAPKLVMLEDLAGVMNALRISFLETTPTVLSLLDPRAVPTLQTVYTAGEALTAHVRARFLPSAVGRLGYVFANAGGPTETTVMSVFAPLEDGDDPRAFGRPFGANRLYVLDPLTRAPVPPGAPGVLYIGGAQLARGYLGAADATARVFMPDPFVDSGARMYDTGDLCSWKDGMLLYHGRADAQVKVRGQRIETGEVEAALVGATCSRVRAACVVKRVLHGREELVGFVDVEVPSSPSSCPFCRSHFYQDPEEQELADVLVEIAAKLTKNMIPAQLIPLRPFPVTQSGKTDRKALETLALDFAANGELPAPVSTESLTPTEDAVRAAWAHALATTHTAIGPDMDFYALGGDSISAIRAAAAARAAGLALTLGDFSSAPTVRAQARLVAARTAVEEETPYAPFALLSSDRHALVLAEAAHHGYTETDVEDAYPSTPSVSGLVALAVANTRVHISLDIASKYVH
jgi:aryl carrier-like protein